MTEDWVRRRLDHPEWGAHVEVDLTDVVKRGRAARRRRQVRRGALGTFAALAVVGGGIAASPLVTSGMRPAAIGPADTPGAPSTAPPSTAPPSTAPPSTVPSSSAPPTLAPVSTSPTATTMDLLACAGADTPVAQAVALAVDIVGSPDYRKPALDDELEVTTAGLKARLIAIENTMRTTMVQQQVVETATPVQIGYVGGGCAHPRYLVAFNDTITQSGKATSHVLELYTASALFVDGRWKLDQLDTVPPPGN